MLRVPDHGRVENRCVDGAANPCLESSAPIAAGLDGIERNVDPGEPCALNLRDSPRTRRPGQGCPPCR